MLMPTLVVRNPQALQELIGKEIGVSDWFAVTQQRIQQFAEATEDHQWIHVDQQRANAESPFGTTIAHGFLTLSLISRFMKGVIRIESGVRLAVNYGLNRVRFPAPLHAGGKIRARAALLAYKELPDSIEAIFSVTLEGEQPGKPNCVAEWIVRYYS